ncbi:NAD(P)/FAD-dependent oxidoreductase [Natronoarchaeum rubrum]|uniref:NAD(P)/FAD-dependent oxidoreductase n=1 Tax=Natronoarchaeum rubrum TaxID=755311 RepID=UPI002110EDBF|nr:FAD-dependent oxidoreductase [Natronoarchaeum rubrum]
MERTVVLGGGEAGLIAAAYLERASETDVIVVSDRARHVFSFRLYRVIEGMPFDCATLDLRDAFGNKDITVVRDHVRGLDATEKRVGLRSGSLQYDTLLIALGAVTRLDAADRGHVSDVRTDAREIRRAVRSDDVCDAVIVGGGPVGVETAATLASLGVDLDVSLLTSGERPLEDFPQRAGSIAEGELDRRGVDVRTGTRATEATENGVVLDGKRVERSDLTIWAGGVEPNPVIESFGLPRNERGLLVDASLRCRDADDVYAVGDVVDYPGKVKDGYSAGLEARRTAKNVLRGIRGRRPIEYDERWHPRIVYLGRTTALLATNGIVHCGSLPAILRAISARSYPFFWKHVY